VSTGEVLSDRRDVLKSGLAVLGGAAGISLLSGESPAQAAATMSVTADHVLGQVVGRQLDESAQIGDTVITTGRLINSRGVGTGHFYAVGTLLALPSAYDRPVVTKLEQHALQLPAGGIYGSGTTDADGAGLFAVTGGTGRYAASRGSYRFTQSVEGLGGNGTATFVLTLIS
jgi:hypothetical protein